MRSTPSANRVVGRAVDHLSSELTRRTLAQRLCAMSIDLPDGFGFSRVRRKRGTGDSSERRGHPRSQEHGQPPSIGPPTLSIIIPTLNERDNIKPLVALLISTLPNIAWEAIIVDDDSTDGTSDRVRALARSNPRIRCLQRIGRRGLVTACIEGVLASASPYVAVMDADLQHDERLLPRMLQVLEGGSVDLVVGSRPPQGVASATRVSGARGLAGSEHGWRGKADVEDPLRGYFMCRREVFEQALR